MQEFQQSYDKFRQSSRRVLAKFQQVPAKTHANDTKAGGREREREGGKWGG
jgi:hypothetical protein